MVQGWVVLAAALAYIGILFAVANFGDNRQRKGDFNRGRPYLYAFSLAIYCTTWTIFGSVGLAASTGINFLAIYLGPILIFTIGYPILKHIVRISKSEHITSVADFIGARYGKSVVVGGVAALIAVVGTVPYIALQLKAISASITTLISHYQVEAEFPFFIDISLIIAIILAIFTILFGTRHADATEHQHGMMLAIAMESVVKLFAFISVGIFVTYYVFDGFGDIFSKASEKGIIQTYISRGFDVGNFLILTVLSTLVFLLLPRQFHVTIVENKSDGELVKARWLFPLYLIAINIFVIPIALAGLIQFGDSVSADNFVLALPMSQEANLPALFAFIGGLSAGTAMVIVATVALAIMVSNHIILPLFLRQRARHKNQFSDNMEQLILKIRRSTILGLLLIAYAYYKMADNTAALASIGLISFAAIAQLAPSFFAGIFWRNANSRGAIAGMIAGICIWSFTLLLPTLLPVDHILIREGLFGIEMLRPQNLFYSRLSPLGNGVIFSLLFNTLCLIVGSLSRSSNGLEKIQSATFVQREGVPIPIKSLSNSPVTVGALMQTVSQYLGEERTDRAFDAYQLEREKSVNRHERSDYHLLQFSEQLLTSTIGASSSRLVHSLLIKRFDRSSKSELRLLDDASQAIQYNQGVLQTALDQIEQGICVFDADYRLSSWNRQFRNMLNLPASVGTPGIALTEIIHQFVAANNLGPDGLDEETIADRLINLKEPWQFELPEENLIFEVRSAQMPQGGLVFTWHNISERVRSAKALRSVNETLEKRVAVRTSELTRLNKKLKKATKAADAASRDKTRFLAAASHDILQPLNAARLYSSTLLERLNDNADHNFAIGIAKSLDSVEDILGDVLAISRLDSMPPAIAHSAFSLERIFNQLRLEFAPVASEKNLNLIFVDTTALVRSEPALLKRLLQNLISNAIKYTSDGKVLVGCRNSDEQIIVEIYDTGIGIADENQRQIFTEFKRLREGAKIAPGLGLGLSIVQRISRLLDHEVSLHSIIGKGTRFQVKLPIAGAQDIKNTPQQTNRPILRNIASGIRVICIDNDEDILTGMRSLLEEWDCKVTTASSCQKIIDIEQNNYQPDIVLMDYHLDEHNGLDEISRLRDHFSQSLVCVLLTAERSGNLEESAKRMGVPIINKPVKLAALRSVLSTIRNTREAAE